MNFLAGSQTAFGKSVNCSEHAIGSFQNELSASHSTKDAVVWPQLDINEQDTLSHTSMHHAKPDYNRPRHCTATSSLISQTCWLYRCDWSSRIQKPHNQSVYNITVHRQDPVCSVYQGDYYPTQPHNSRAVILYSVKILISKKIAVTPELQNEQ